MMPLRFHRSAPVRSSVTFLFVALVAIVLAFLGAACGSSSAKPVAQRPSTTATVEIVSPTGGQTVTGSTLHVVLRLTGGTIVPTSTTTPLGSNEGHIHLIDNGSVISMAFGTEQDIPITPGSHILQAEFVASDHLPFSPRVVASVHFTAQ
jgi:hypothetical protein